MPNTFLGFPVPRARIAEMVASVDLYAAKGITWLTLFDSLDGIYKASSPAGGVSLTSTSIQLATNNAGTSWASAYKDPSEFKSQPSWAQGVKFKTDATFSSSPASGGRIDLVAGSPGTGRHVGFCVIDGILYGTVGNGTTETKTPALENWGASGYYQTKTLEVIYDGTKAVFYVDGVEKATISTGLPTGTTHARILWRAFVQNLGNLNYMGLVMSHYRVYKDVA